MFLPPIQSYLNIVKRITYSNSISSIRIFSRLANPHVLKVTFNSLSFFNRFHLCVVAQKLFPLRIFRAFFNMKSMRNDRKSIFPLKFIKSLNVVKESFLVSNVIIALKMVMEMNVIRVLDTYNGFLLIKFSTTLVCIFHNNSL